MVQLLMEALNIPEKKTFLVIFLDFFSIILAHTLLCVCKLALLNWGIFVKS